MRAPSSCWNTWSSRDLPPSHVWSSIDLHVVIHRSSRQNREPSILGLHYGYTYGHQHHPTIDKLILLATCNLSNWNARINVYITNIYAHDIKQHACNSINGPGDNTTSQYCIHRGKNEKHLVVVFQVLIWLLGLRSKGPDSSQLPTKHSLIMRTNTQLVASNWYYLKSLRMLSISLEAFN